jgi:hypothetical protein
MKKLVIKPKAYVKVSLTLACWNYDRTRALMEGSIVPEGIDLNYLSLPVEELFRTLSNQEFDVAELSLSSYLLSLQKPKTVLLLFRYFHLAHFAIQEFLLIKIQIKSQKI